MDSSQKYFELIWKYHSPIVAESFYNYLQEEKFTDMSIVCQGHTIKCHKLILTAASSYFEEEIMKLPHTFPVFILNDIPFSTLGKIMEFIYRGVVTVDDAELAEFMEAAKRLNVKGIVAKSGRVTNAGSNLSKSSNPAAADNCEKGTSSSPLKKRALRKFKTYSELDMKNAIDLVKIGVLPSDAAEAHSVILRTLYRRLKSAGVPVLEKYRRGKREGNSYLSAAAKRIKPSFEQSFSLQLPRKETAVTKTSGSTKEIEVHGKEEAATGIQEQSNSPPSQPIPKGIDDDDDIMIVAEFSAANK